MPDIATITAFIGSIKTATDIAKAIKDADLSLEKAESKLKLAELIEALAEAKIQAADIQEVIQEKDREITRLKKSFEFNSILERNGNAYYKKEKLGLLIDEPFCSH